jgi:RNA polymerase sigma factor (sigma-70 family)
MPDEEEQLKRAIHRPSATAFVAGVAAQYGQRLRQFLARRLRNASDAPDLEQEVYMRLLRLERPEMTRSPEAYLITIASHLLYEHALRQSTGPVLVEFDDVAAEFQSTVDEEPAQLAERLEQTAYLERMLAKLPPRPLAALLMHRVLGFTLEEIAGRLGVSRPMAKKYVARALAHCRELMDTE